MPSPRRARNVDAESGKNRVTLRNRRARPPPPDEESEEFISSDSELESDLDMPAKDDSRRPKVKRPLPARKGALQDGRSSAIHGEEDHVKDTEPIGAKESDNKVAPHMAVLLSATYHLGLSSISRPSVSSFIPSVYNLFSMLEALTSLLCDNTLLHQMCPEFFSPVLFLYYGHAFYYQVLRARNAAGTDVLTRIEKRALTYYERVGPAESWPIASPLLGMFSYIAAHKTEDPMYGWIVPMLPDFSQLNLNGTPNALGSLSKVPGIARVPLIPALQKMVYNFAHGISDFENGLFRPVGQDALDANHTFCGLTSSSVTNNDFLTLSGNLAWLTPLETGDDIGSFDFDIKQGRIRRWNVPDVLDNADLTTLAQFLGFSDNQSFDWMKHLLSTAAIANRFFPGSGNLSQVSPYTTIGMATKVTYSRSPAVKAERNQWYYPRTGLTLSTHGYTNTETGLIDTKMAITVSPNARYCIKAANQVSVAPGITLSHEETGPFFLDDPDPNHAHERSAVIITENANQIDPARRFVELLTRYYDNKAGRG